MSGLFGKKPPPPIPVVNPSDTVNRVNDGLIRKLAAGGSTADQVSNTIAPVASVRAPTLTGLA